MPATRCLRWIWSGAAPRPRARQATYDSLPPAEILKNLDRAFGVGVGAKKERAKLAARIAGTSKPTSKPLPPPPPPGMKPLNTKRLSLSSKDKRAGKAVTAVVATTIAAIKS